MDCEDDRRAGPLLDGTGGGPQPGAMEMDDVRPPAPSEVQTSACSLLRRNVEEADSLPVDRSALLFLARPDWMPTAAIILSFLAHDQHAADQKHAHRHAGPRGSSHQAADSRPQPAPDDRRELRSEVKHSHQPIRILRKSTRPVCAWSPT